MKLKISESIPSLYTSLVAMKLSTPETNPAASQADFHHPDFPISCSRRVVSADVGSRIAKANRVVMMPEP